MTTAARRDRARTHHRQALAEGHPQPTDPTAGDFGAGLLPAVSLCTVGPAEGHGFWCDPTFIQQIVDAGQAAGQRGLKSRFTHPGMCTDGLGNALGRFKNFRTSTDGRQALADLHFHPTAWDGPNGELAPYVLDLAATDPQALGASIVFYHDRAAEDQFQLDNSKPGPDGEPVFTSPDPANEQHLPHTRLARLTAADLVDEPAANAGGLFSAHDQDLAAAATALADYALGLTTNRPATALEIDPDRAREFLGRYLAAKQLAIQPATPAPNRPADLDRGTLREQLARYAAKFGAEKAAQYLIEDNLPWPEALERWADSLLVTIGEQAVDHATALATAQATIDDLTRRLAAVHLGQPAPLSQGDRDTPPDQPPARQGHLTPGQARYAARFRLRGDEN